MLLIGLVGLGLWAAGVFRFSTDKGDLVFESDDPDFAFAAAKDGGVTLEDRKTQRTYRVQATPRERDEYELEVLDKDAGLSFKTRTFTVKRGDKVALKAWFERKKDEGQPAAPAVRFPPLEDAWFKQVAALPAEKQVDAVVAKLKERNPGFDGKVTHKIEQSEVIELGLSGRVKDISALRALSKLRAFRCWEAPLSDLSPLKGMPLTSLYCYNTRVSDLSPLKDMSLISLTLSVTRVSDLSPLKGMPLTWLSCEGTSVSDLSPLKGMKLAVLLIHNTPVSDLSPLEGMPLKNLWCDFKPERDVEILRSLKTLETINGKRAAEFWKEVDAKAANKKP